MDVGLFALGLDGLRVLELEDFGFESLRVRVLGGLRV